MKVKKEVEKEVKKEVKTDNTFQPIKVLNLPPKNIRLGRAERKILHDITIDFLSFKEIINRRKCSKEAVYKVIRRLKKKGVINNGFQSVENVGSTNPLDNLSMRLHSQEWNIKIISKSNKYIESMKKGNTQLIDGNTIRLYNDSIEIYSGQSFFEKDEQRATALSLGYWRRFFTHLEHEFKIVLVKPRVQNIDLVNQHYGETNSEMAKEALEKKEKVRIITEDDGKIWFLIDNSWNLKERECIHPETAKQDSEKVSKQLNDWRLNDPPTNSELNNYVTSLAMATKDLPTVLNELKEQIASHLALINEYRKENKSWRKAKEKEISKLKEQTKLGAFS